MKKILIAATAALAIVACGGTASKSVNGEAVGRWVIADPLDAENVMGVELMMEGSARSINMATLVYSSWALTEEPGVITITGQSIGNGQTIDFSEKAVISRDAEGHITLTIGEILYTKEN